MSSSSDLAGRPDEAVRPLDLPALRRTILAGLTPRQAEAATLDGPVLVLAGAGTGKTRTLTAGVAWRIGARGFDPDRILAVTFTNKAAKEMADRIRMLAGQRAPSWIGTFHGLGARQLRIEPDVATLRPGFDILDADDSRRMVKRTLEAMKVAIEDTGEGRDPLKRLCNRIASMKDHLVVPDEALAHVEGLVAVRRRRAARSIPKACVWPPGSTSNTSAGCARRTRPTSATSCFWPAKTMQRDLEYRRRWAGRFDCVLTDEYQDVCYAQCAWLRLLAAGHGEIFASATTTRRCTRSEAPTSPISAASPATSPERARSASRTTSAAPGTSSPRRTA